MRVFISWSGRGSLSWRAARLLNNYLPEIMDGVETWFSEDDIMAGANWRNGLLEALKGTDYCVVCLDRNSLRSQWVSFEAGFIANSLADSSICPYLVGLSPRALRGPLSAYNAKTADKEGTWDLFLAIARKQQPGRGPYEHRLKSRFNLYWEHELGKEFGELTQPGASVLLPEPPRPGAGAPVVPAPREPGGTEPPPSSAEPETQMLIAPPAEPEGIVKAGPESFQLWLFNTSYYSRKGYVAHDWETIHKATGLGPDEVVVRDEKGDELPSQVDYFEHSDPTQSVLVFSLLNEIPQVPEDYSVTTSYVTIERGKPRQWPNTPQVSVEEQGGRARRVRLVNNSLEVWLELQPKPGAETGNWYAGAATSVLLDGKEILDAFGAMFGIPDTEKRCMQLDRLWLLFSGRGIPHRDFNLINNWYQLISKTAGPVRSAVEIASQPFTYSIPGSPGQALRCRLHRIISLYKGANYIKEELKVYRMEPSGGLAGQLDFNTRYFSYMDVGLQPHIHKTEKSPKWFAVGSRWAPYQGYGFATDAQLASVVNPDPDFPKNGSEDRSFVWELRSCGETTCLHMFMRDNPKEMESEVRSAWHELIDRPLVAKIKW
jgi:hypothetical protein